MAPRKAHAAALARHGRVFIAICAAVALVDVTGCNSQHDGEDSEDSNRLVLYVSADDYLARQVVKAFEGETGIEVEMVGDSEVNKTTGLANRIRAERDNPQADVFWSSEAFMMIQLAEEGLLAPLNSDRIIDWPPSLTGKGRTWHGFGLRARALVYSPGRVSEEALPHEWIDLAHPQWRGRIVMADPRFGTTRGHMGAMKAFWGEERFQKFLNGLAANDVRVLTSGNAGVVQAVASGEADLGMTDSDDVWAGQRNGQQVDLLYPAHGQPGKAGEGTLLIPNSVALVSGSRRMMNGVRFIEFLLGDEVARLMAESDSHNIPVRESIAAEFPQFAVVDALEIELDAVAREMDAAVAQAMQVLGDGR